MCIYFVSSYHIKNLSSVQITSLRTLGNQYPSLGLNTQGSSCSVPHHKRSFSEISLNLEKAEDTIKGTVWGDKNKYFLQEWHNRQCSWWYLWVTLSTKSFRKTKNMSRHKQLSCRITKSRVKVELKHKTMFNQCLTGQIWDCENRSQLWSIYSN